jgi:hypothetical protein
MVENWYNSSLEYLREFIVTPSRLYAFSFGRLLIISSIHAFGYSVSFCMAFGRCVFQGLIYFIKVIKFVGLGEL